MLSLVLEVILCLYNLGFFGSFQLLYKVLVDLCLVGQLLLHDRLMLLDFNVISLVVHLNTLSHRLHLPRMVLLQRTLHLLDLLLHALCAYSFKPLHLSLVLCLVGSLQCPRFLVRFLSQLSLLLIQIFSLPLQKLPLTLYFSLNLLFHSICVVDLLLQGHNPLLARLEGLSVTDAALDGRLVLGLPPIGVEL